VQQDLKTHLPQL